MHEIEYCRALSGDMRKTILSVPTRFGAHWGGSLSCLDILAVLYGAILNCKAGDLPYETKDKFIMSKGHAAMALYVALAETGLIPKAMLQTFQQDGSHISEHVVLDNALHTEHSGGSLGLGPSLGVGMAFYALRRNCSFRTYVLAGDGECNEGIVWEAIMLAGHLKLNNLCLIIDSNKQQADKACDDVIYTGNFTNRLLSFGWKAIQVDGHDCAALYDAFSEFKQGGTQPTAIIANTIKGKGVSFMEGDITWHHKGMDDKQLELAKKEAGIQ